MDADFERIYNTYYMQVYSYVMTLTRNSHDAEEITQKTFFKAMSSNKKYQGGASELTWLCAIAKNLFIDEYRAKKRKAPIGIESAADGSFESVLEDEDSAFRIHQAVHSMDEPYKEVFQLRVFGELSFRKIGLLFSKTENWARVTYHRARIKIQERMEIQ